MFSNIRTAHKKCWWTTTCVVCACVRVCVCACVRVCVCAWPVMSTDAVCAKHEIDRPYIPSVPS